MSDPFLGEWELDPSSIKYDVGRPGRRAKYSITATADGLIFSLDGEDADQKPLKFSYGGPLDGVDREISRGVTLALTRVDRTSIESTLRRDGRVVDRWMRVLQPDERAILFTQYVVDPDGKEFRNTSLYRRVDTDG